MADRTYVLKLIADIQDFKKKLGEADDNIKGMKDQANNYKKAIGGLIATAAAVSFGKQIVTAASDQEQAIGALNSVFGELSGTMNEFGKTTASNLGISRAEFSQLASVTGSLLKGAGVPLDQVAESTKGITERAADMAAMFGGTVPDAIDSINAALKGERDPIEKYGVSINEAAVQAKALAMGLVDSEGKVTDQGKKLATLQLIYDKTADSAGTFKKEQGSMAGSMQTLGAEFKDLQADLGKKLLPVIVEFAKVLRGIVGFISENTSWLIPLATGLIAIVAGFKAWTLAIEVWKGVQVAATAAQWLWNAALTANPIGIIIVAITAIIAAIVLLYTKVDWFRAGVDAAIDGVVTAFKWLWDMIKKVYEWVKENWPLLLAILTGPIGIAVKLIVDNWETIKSAFSKVIDFIKTVMSTVFNILTAPYRLAIDAVKRIIEEVPGAVRNIVSGIGTALSNIWTTVTKPFVDAFNEVKRIGQTVSDFFYNLPGKIGGFFSNIASVIKSPFETAFNAIKRLWNSTVGGFGFSVPSWVPGIGGKGWNIPKMATGGIVTKPTIALIGEAGPEAVVPLNGGGIGGTVILNVYALTASAEVGRQVLEALREYERISGNKVA